MEDMDRRTRNGILGLVLISIGAGLTTAGIALVVPICATWSRSKLLRAYRNAKQGLLSGIEDAAEALGEMASKAQEPLGQAAKAARQTTAIAAGSIESAAHYIKEQVQ